MTGSDGSFSEDLRAAAEPHWGRATGHRFTALLGRDELEDVAYRRYLVQDYLFLDVLAQVLGYAIAKAPGMPPKSRLAGFLAAVTSEENDYFLRSFEALGVSQEAREQAEVHPVMRRLGAVMLEAAREGDYADCLAVLLPAEWIYLTWAKAQPETLPKRFWLAEWITLHRIPEFEAFVTWLQAEMDREGAGLAETRRAELSKRFSAVCELEVGFFDLAFEDS